MKLYDYGASANCLKVRILLAHLGLAYERVPVDIFAGESQTAEHLARNPAGRTPVLELDSGELLAESNAILLFLARGTPYLPAEPVEEAHVWQWLFFEQNLVEPNVGSARFWRLTGRDELRREAWELHRASGAAALGILERHVAADEFLVAGRYTVADIGLYAYAHVADQGEIDLEPFPAVRAWLERVESQPGFVNDLEPYPPGARAGAGGASVHDREPA
ncbi:MAG TPA: glutathione S-transferase family protein [Gaiellaceae bacterium]|nr:glutathione S-transferase family protein [Gaiellaceae bacterium]